MALHLVLPPCCQLLWAATCFLLGPFRSQIAHGREVPGEAQHCGRMPERSDVTPGLLQVDLVPGFTRDVTGLGHHGTGGLDLGKTRRDLRHAPLTIAAS